MPKLLTDQEIIERVKQNGYECIDVYDYVYNSGKIRTIVEIMCVNKHKRQIGLSEIKKQCTECRIDEKIKCRI